ncbi:hypothetical protein J2853_007074 [Streptosporangium lutulentum]|uniref:GNAT family N-acetyltransferase n=1 Tax=Streptosporangium lutulentum TaxID=1461250 RepID=A0ABT9QNP9_9ACTN|nr:hypothetical protein [Streptosporangium lutulentum]
MHRTGVVPAGPEDLRLIVDIVEAVWRVASYLV